MMIGSDRDQNGGNSMLRAPSRARSAQLYDEALRHIVGGVNSPSRSFKAVGGGAPVFMRRAQGAYFWDVDGNRYIDYLAAYGPLILGHAHPQVTAAIVHAAENGVLYGTPTELEIEFAQLLKEAIPSLDRVRFVNSGTEAVMTTIRVARAYTGRNKIIKFAGCYHGHSDLVLVAAGSGPSTLGIPDSAGVTQGVAREVITVPFNDLPALAEALDRWGDDVAAVMVEPIVGNFGIVMPAPGFLAGLCKLTRERGALVIYDEVISAFRFHYGAAHTLAALGPAEAIRPDLTALGKIIGGGLPIGAYGGRAAIMEQVAPLGPAYQAGTMAGNPASMAAGIACLQALRPPRFAAGSGISGASAGNIGIGIGTGNNGADAGSNESTGDGIYAQLDALGRTLTSGLAAAARKHGVELTINRVCGAFSTHFCGHPITNYAEAQATDGDVFAAFFRHMLDQGVCLAPSKYEAWFLMASHTIQDIEHTISAADYAFGKINQPD